jgi:hypothetical protein
MIKKQLGIASAFVLAALAGARAIETDRDVIVANAAAVAQSTDGPLVRLDCVHAGNAS